MSTRHWRAGVATVLVIGALYGCALALAIYGINRERPAPFSYADVTPAGAYPRQLCPGDRLVFDILITVTRAPSVVLVAENWQSGPRSIPDHTPVLFIQERVKETRAQQSALVPALSPGGWVYERAGIVTNGAGQPALLLIPFEVRAGS